MASNDLPARGSRTLTGSVFRADFRPFYNILQAGSTSLEAAREGPLQRFTSSNRASNRSSSSGKRFQLSHWRITERRVRQSRRVYGDLMRNNPSRVAMRRLLAKRHGQAEASHWGRRWRTVDGAVLSGNLLLSEPGSPIRPSFRESTSQPKPLSSTSCPSKVPPL
jgi:hypothetical protein